MSTEKRGYAPPKNGEQEKIKGLVRRAEELKEKFEALLERNHGEYPEHEILSSRDRHFDEDREVVRELESFFDEDCRDIPSVEVGTGGNYTRDVLKKLSDTLWLLRRANAYYEVDRIQYSIIDKREAVQVLQTSIETRKKEIQALEAKNQAAEKLLS